MDVKALLQLLRTMYRVRLFEEKIEFLFKRGKLGGTVHLCIGQEACAAGICAALGDGDVVSGTHRGHGHAIAKGLALDRLFAELMGKRDGYCKGKGGTQHVASFAHGFLGTNGITGGGIPIATGAALAIAHRGQPNIAVTFFGDGAVNQGVFHESLNFASIWNLPVLYVCENNLYAMSARTDQLLAAESIAARARAYRIESVAVDGMDVLEVYRAADAAVRQMRRAPRPYFIECRTYRYAGHSKSDVRKYRTRDEEQQWQDRDPIRAFTARLVDEGTCGTDEIESVRAEVAEEVEKAVEFALASPENDMTELFRDVYAHE